MFKQQTDQRTALFLADGCEEIEALTVADILYRAGIPCTKVSVNETEKVVSSHEVAILADTTVKDLDFEEYNMLILPGGIPGTPNLAACAPLMEAVRSFAAREAEGKCLSAICAAPSIFAQMGLLKGRTATSNPAFLSVLREHGAIVPETTVAVDGGYTTSQAMGTAIPFALAIVSRYLGEETARELGKDILYL